MHRTIAACAVFASLALLAGPLAADTYVGSLVYNPSATAEVNQLFVDGHDEQWPAYGITLAWEVTNTDNSQPGFAWRYRYTLSLDGDNGGGISHFILETSEGLTAADIAGLTGAKLDSIGRQKANAGSPQMPEDVYGIRVDPADDETMTMDWSFYSNRAPVWGDFYAKGGKKGGRSTNLVFNWNRTSDGDVYGFGSGDWDPTAPAANGSLHSHILRPDTSENVPEPTALAMLGVGGWLALRRRPPVH